MRGGSLGCVRGKDYLEVDSEELIDFWRKRLKVRREYRTSLSKSQARLWKGDHWVAWEEGAIWIGCVGSLRWCVVGTGTIFRRRAVEQWNSGTVEQWRGSSDAEGQTNTPLSNRPRQWLILGTETEGVFKARHMQRVKPPDHCQTNQTVLELGTK